MQHDTNDKDNRTLDEFLQDRLAALDSEHEAEAELTRHTMEALQKEYDEELIYKVAKALVENLRK